MDDTTSYLIAEKELSTYIGATFNNARFNPRWEHGTADYTGLLLPRAGNLPGGIMNEPERPH